MAAVAAGIVHEAVGAAAPDAPRKPDFSDIISGPDPAAAGSVEGAATSEPGPDPSLA
jgi:hypothetical protein